MVYLTGELTMALYIPGLILLEKGQTEVRIATVLPGQAHDRRVAVWSEGSIPWKVGPFSSRNLGQLSRRNYSQSFG